MDYDHRLMYIGIESLEQRRKARDIEFLFNTLHENVLYDSSLAVERAQLTRSLRNSHSMRVRLPFTIPSNRRSTFVSRSISAWNDLAEDIVSDSNAKKFKMRIKQTKL